MVSAVSRTTRKLAGADYSRSRAGIGHTVCLCAFECLKCPAYSALRKLSSLQLRPELFIQSCMRILVIGGNGFIGSPLVKELLGSGHEVALFHRRSNAGLADSGVVQIQGDRNRLSDYESQLRRFSPDVIVDMILSSGEQARQRWRPRTKLRDESSRSAAWTCTARGAWCTRSKRAHWIRCRSRRTPHSAPLESSTRR